MKDPAYQAWILKPDLTGFAAWGSNRVYDAEAFVAWLEEQAREWVAAAPKPGGVEFRTESAKEVEGELRFEAIDKARRGDRPILIYFQQPGVPSGLSARGRVEEIKASREFERGPLSSEAVVKLAEGFECFRIDLSKEADRRLAKRMGVDVAPTVLLWPVGKEDAAEPCLLKKPAEKALREAMRAMAGGEQK
jgi:hypothetical protein